MALKQLSLTGSLVLGLSLNTFLVLFQRAYLWDSRQENALLGGGETLLCSLFLFWGYFCLKRTQDVIRCPSLSSRDDFDSIILLPKSVAFQAAQLPMTSLVTAIFRCFNKRLLFTQSCIIFSLCFLPKVNLLTTKDYVLKLFHHKNI